MSDLQRHRRLSYDDGDLAVSLVEPCGPDMSRDAHIARLFARVLRLVEPEQMGVVLATLIQTAYDGLETVNADKCLIAEAGDTLAYWNNQKTKRDASVRDEVVRLKGFAP